MVEWSEAFGGISILLHAADREWVMQPHRTIHWWEGANRELAPGLTLVHCGGHFPGGAVLHWRDRVISRGKVKWLGKFVAEFSSGYDGEVGWSQSKDEGFRKLEGNQLQQLILDNRLDREARLDELYPTRKALPGRTVDGKKHHVLEMSTTFDTQEIWCFDAASGLLTRTKDKHTIKVKSITHDAIIEADKFAPPSTAMETKGESQ